MTRRILLVAWLAVAIVACSNIWTLGSAFITWAQPADATAVQNYYIRQIIIITMTTLVGMVVLGGVLWRASRTESAERPPQPTPR